jgi:DNA-binding HxlR family transcriptional regulator
MKKPPEDERREKPRSRQRRSRCPIAVSLDLLGDRWTLLVLRDMVFRGHRYFQQFAESPEGIATNTLAERLDRLERAGVIRQDPDPDDGRRKRYVLTEDGLAAIPLLVDLIVWGAKLDPGIDYPERRLAWMTNERDDVIRYYREKLTGGAASAEAR